MKTLEKIRFYWGAFTISTIVAVIMIPLVTIFNKYKGTIMHKLNGAILFFMGAKVKAYGKRDSSANLFLMNHHGIMDIIALEAIENIHLRWVAKKELFDAPWFGYILKNTDMISVNRENKSGLIKLLKDAKETIEVKNRAIAIFPEGTRAKGQKLLKFKAGAKIVANKLNMRVQPIVILGSKNVLNEHIKTGHSGTIEVHYLDAFNVQDAPKDWYENLQNSMQEYIDNLKIKRDIER
jgi:1-acyl-sn-glycerol-3-phosphate acyltransferase